MNKPLYRIPTMRQINDVQKNGFRDDFGNIICRDLTISELKRLSSFPDDFQLTGTPKQQYERIGNCVPPLMTKAIAEAILDGVLKKHKPE